MSLVLNNRRRVLNLVWFLFDCLFPKEHRSSSSSSCSPSVSFRIYLICTLKSVTHRTPPNCLFSNPLLSLSNTEHRIQKWFIHFKQVLFRALAIEARGILNFFQAITVTNSAIWLVLSAVRNFLSLTTVTVTLAWVFFPLSKQSHLREREKKVIYRLRSVRIVKNCDLGLENAARGRRPETDSNWIKTKT